MLGRQWYTKPPQGTPLNPNWGLAPYLSGIIPFNEGSGAPIIQGQYGALAGTTVLSPAWSNSLYGIVANPCLNTTSGCYTYGLQYASALGLYWSIVAWLYPTGSSNNGVIIGKGIYGTPSFYIQGDGGLGVTLNVDSKQPKYANVLTANTWNCCVFSCSNGTATVYNNGIVYPRTGGDAALLSSSDTTHNLKIGDYDTGGYPWVGYIGQVEIYSGYALSAGQAADRYSFPFAPFASPLPWWLGAGASGSAAAGASPYRLGSSILNPIWTPLSLASMADRYD